MRNSSDQYVQVVFLIKVFMQRCLKVHFFSDPNVAVKQVKMYGNIMYKASVFGTR